MKRPVNCQSYLYGSKGLEKDQIVWSQWRTKGRNLWWSVTITFSCCQGLLSVRTISLLFGKDRFQSFILEWFSSIQSKSNLTNHKVLSYLYQTTKTDPLNIDLNSNSNENSILELLQMVTKL